MQETNLVNLIRDAAQKDIKNIQSEINTILNNLKLNIDENQMQEEIDLFNGLIDVLSRDNSLNDAPNTIATINVIGNLNSQIDIMDDKLTLLRPSIMSSLRSLFSLVKSQLKNLSLHLWQLLSQLMTPKNWSIQGSAGINNLFGLSGDIQIQITFGA
jgi:hypothetical protein